jgi:hypothetical protein
MQQKEGLCRRIGSTIRTWKALPRYFPLYFQLPYPPEDQYAGSLAVEGTSQAVLGSSDQWKVPASLSLFLKSEKIIVLLCVGKGHEYRRFVRDFFTVPSAYQHRATELKSRKGLSTAPSPIWKGPLLVFLVYIFWSLACSKKSNFIDSLTKTLPTRGSYSPGCHSNFHVVEAPPHSCHLFLIFFFSFSSRFSFWFLFNRDETHALCWMHENIFFLNSFYFSKTRKSNK